MTGLSSNDCLRGEKYEALILNLIAIILIRKAGCTASALGWIPSALVIALTQRIDNLLADADCRHRSQCSKHDDTTMLTANVLKIAIDTTTCRFAQLKKDSIRNRKFPEDKLPSSRYHEQLILMN